MEPISFNPGELDNPEGNSGDELDLAEALGIPDKRIDEIHLQLEAILNEINDGRIIRVGRMIASFLKVPTTQAELIYVCIQAGVKAEQIEHSYEPLDSSGVDWEELIRNAINNNKTKNEN